ncbi:hypothetical protein PFICI_00542 [Pestalotiopsis fici W106-1]|uniref:Uncharacterized protein n=1 Tax=Pestalotiopsis fici (strain W106-1 / CGMCC3.15140) TaxID=1229662 RepID=W3XL43_PESFW|nr:uncharacterized protein PFICI_00542 [Pestalotiopsis fici W106-1]ETS86714.1 hypothetical protein PFICI_00542 [Pestalotiopsis fici W106-1]
MTGVYSPPSPPQRPNFQWVLATPPDPHRKLLTLTYTPNRLKPSQKRAMEDTLQTRRDDARKNKMIRIPEIPMEAAVVALHPCYRGTKLDGGYYEWLNRKVYNFEMPDIVRRVNKFRGFPQRDDPKYNIIDPEKYQEHYRSEKGQAELEPYMPYLRKYWATNGDVFDEHLDTLDSYHEDTDEDEGRHIDVLEGYEDSRIMGDVAEAVCGLSTPPSLHGPSRWEQERKDFTRDVARRASQGKRIVEATATAAIRDSAEEHGSLAWESANGLLSSPLTLNGSSPNLSGFFESIEQDRSNAQSPGLIWWNPFGSKVSSPVAALQNSSPIPPIAPSPVFSPVPELERAYQGASPRSPPHSVNLSMNRPASAMAYHSPAGEIFTSRASCYPEDARWENFRARSNVQNLAIANAFEPVPWMAGHSPVFDTEQKDNANEFGSLGFPMGIRRWHHYRAPSHYGPPEHYEPPADDYTWCTCPEHSSGLQDTVLTSSSHPENFKSVRDRVPTPLPFVTARAEKRQREDDADDEASDKEDTVVVRTEGRPAAKRRRTDAVVQPKWRKSQKVRKARKSGKSKKGKRGKKRQHGSDDDEYEFTGLEVADEDKAYERV